MFKFVFNGKRIASREDNTPKPQYDVTTNVTSMEHEEVKKQNARERKENKAKAIRTRNDLDAPFVIMTGDPSYHPVTNPHVEKPTFHFVHKSIEGYKGRSKRGLPYARHLKMLLRGEVGSTYQRTSLTPEHYRNYLDKDQVKLIEDSAKASGKHSGTGIQLEAYMPMAQSTEFSPAYRQILDSIEQSKIRRNKGRTNETIERDDPEDPVSLAKTYGADALSYMLNVNPSMPYRNGPDLCLCGEEANKHVTAEEAKNHFLRTGQHLEIHPFVRANDAKNASEIMLAQSPLLKITRPEEQLDGSMAMKEDVKAFSDESGVKGNWLPMVRIGLKSTRFRRMVSSFRQTEGYGQNVPNTDRVLQEQEYVKCPGCHAGELHPNQMEGAANCEDCTTPGHVTYKPKKDFSGKTSLKPYTRAVGDGYIQYINPEDAPRCSAGCVDGKIYNDKSGGGTTCRTCNGSGKDMTAFPCTNHTNAGPAIQLTPNNKHTSCEQGFIRKTISKLSPRKIRLNEKEDGQEHEGNVRFAVPFRHDISSNIKGILWKGHGDKNCTRCHGDDEYQTEYNLPCNCRIAGPNDTNVLPGNVNVIERNNINIPESHYQRHMLAAYNNNMNNSPHEIGNFPNLIDPETGETTYKKYRSGSVQMFRPGQSVNPSSFLGLWTPGKRIPVAAMIRLKDKSRVHAQSRNAKFCAASADLEAVNEEFSNNFKTYPDLIPTSMMSTVRNTRMKTRARRLDTAVLPETIQEPVTRMENTLSDLSEGYSGRYNRLANNVYTHAALLTGATDPKKDASWSKFHKNSRRLLDVIERFEGQKAKEDVAEHIRSLVPSSNI